MSEIHSFLLGHAFMQEELAAARTAVSAAEDARIAAEVSERRMAATVIIYPFSRQSHHMPCCTKISGKKGCACPASLIRSCPCPDCPYQALAVPCCTLCRAGGQSCSSCCLQSMRKWLICSVLNTKTCTHALTIRAEPAARAAGAAAAAVCSARGGG